MELAEIRKKHKSINYHIKREIITKNCSAWDIMEEACEIAKLRLFLALVSSAHSVDELEPLPNIDFNILPGQLHLLACCGWMMRSSTSTTPSIACSEGSYRSVVDEKNRLIDLYRDSREYQEQLHSLPGQDRGDETGSHRTLDDILLDEVQQTGHQV